MTARTAELLAKVEKALERWELPLLDTGGNWKPGLTALRELRAEIARLEDDLRELGRQRPGVSGL